MKAYKGFDKDMTCRGFQYEVGKSYETERAKMCEEGFHACEDPIDCLSYYEPATSQYHEVDLDDVSGERAEDSKVVAKKITIGARIELPALIKAGIDFRFSKAEKIEEHATGDSGAASATGYKGAASATGYGGAASATGKAGVAVAAGVNCKAKGAIGCALFLVDRRWNGYYYEIANVKAVIVDGEKVKANTWYMLVDGEFQECE